MNDLELAAQIKEGGLRALQSALKYDMKSVHSLLCASYYYIEDKSLRLEGKGYVGKSDCLLWRVRGIYLNGVCVWFQEYRKHICGLLWSTDPRAKYKEFCHPAPHAGSGNAVLRRIEEAPQAIHGKIDSVLKDIFKIIEKGILRRHKEDEENQQALINNWKCVFDEVKPTLLCRRCHHDQG